MVRFSQFGGDRTEGGGWGVVMGAACGIDFPHSAGALAHQFCQELHTVSFVVSPEVKALLEERYISSAALSGL